MPKFKQIALDISVQYQGGTLEQTLEVITKLFKENIPVEYHDVAQIEFNTESDYDDCERAVMHISYNRPETLEEEKVRLNFEQSMKESRKRMYEQLKKEFNA